MVLGERVGAASQQPGLNNSPKEKVQSTPAAATAAAGDSQQMHTAAYSRSCRRQCTPATAPTADTTVWAAAAGFVQHMLAAAKPAAAAPTMETRSCKKRRIALSPGGAAALRPSSTCQSVPSPDARQRHYPADGRSGGSSDDATGASRSREDARPPE